MLNVLCFLHSWAVPEWLKALSPHCSTHKMQRGSWVTGSPLGLVAVFSPCTAVIQRINL